MGPLLYSYGALNIVLAITLAIFFIGAAINVRGIGKGILPILLPTLLVLEASRIVQGVIWLNSNITVENSWTAVVAAMVLRGIGIAGLWVVNIKLYKQLKTKAGGHKDVK